MMQATIYKIFHLEIAHHLPKVSPDSPCARLHGHSLKITLEVTGPVDTTMGWVMDSREIGEQFMPFYRQLDHRYLNEIEGLENPTSENLAQWIWHRLKPQLPALSAIQVAETHSQSIRYWE